MPRVFDERGVNCEHSADGDLVVVQRRNNSQRILANFAAGEWQAAGWWMAHDKNPDAHRIEVIEEAPPGQFVDDDAYERVVELDRKYFEAHPGEDLYIRDALPGEWPVGVVGHAPGPGARLMVSVLQYRPGVRFRKPDWVAPWEAS